MKIKVMEKVLAANDAWAEENRSYLREKGIRMFNIIGSPGAGKTTLLEKTIEMLKGQYAIGVIEGDIATSKDAERIQKKGVPVFQINTGTACHLDANLINAALKDISAENALDLIFVENIGNLVCPAEFDIGEEGKIAVLSVTEGGDKVEKYPLLFSEAKILLITKTALLPYTNFEKESVIQAFKNLNSEAGVCCVDSLSGDGFEEWIGFIKREMEKK